MVMLQRWSLSQIMVMLQRWSLKWRENGHITEVVSLGIMNGHVTELTSLMDEEWSCYRGGQFNAW